MESTPQATVKEAPKTTGDRPLVVVIERNRAPRWTAEEAWELRWEKIMAAAE